MSEKELPAGWVSARLGDVLLTIEAGKSFTCEPRRAELGEWGVVKVSAMTWGRFEECENKAVPEGYPFNPAYEIRPGDILVSRANTREYVGAPVLVGQCRPKLLLSDKSLRLVPSGLVSKKWLVHLLGSPAMRRWISDKATGTKDSMRNISQKMLLEAPFLLPPREEQDRIVEALEGHLSRLDAAASNVARCELRIPKLEGAIRGRFTGSLSESDELPDGWRWGSLEDVLARIEAGKSFRCEPRPARDQEWGVIKVSAMTWGEFRVSEHKAVPAGKEFDRRHEIKEGDILVSRANTADYVGAPVIVKQTRPRLLLSDKSLRLVPARGVNKAWLITALASPYVRQQISARATGTKDSMRNISQRELAAVRIPIPPAAEQRHIADQVDAHLLASGRFSAEMRQAKARSKNLRASLFDSAFSGALVPQDPADEPAVALLARIQADRAAHPKAKRARRTLAGPPKAKAPMAPAPSPTSAPTHSVQQEFDL